MFFFSAAVFFLGLAVGSFLNAVICRLGTRESAFKGRSRCPHCGHLLAWRDLIPIASFVLLCGRCRYCKEPISWQYPLVEFGTGAIFLLTFWHLGFDIDSAFDVWILSFGTLFYLWTIASLLVVLFVYDLKHYILPDKILFPAIFVSGIWYFVSGIFFQLYTRYEILNTLYAALGAAIFFLAIFLISHGKAMGLGDVKLAAFMGLFLGWPGITVALFISFMAGAAVGVLLIVAKKKKLKSEVPFGPFLIFGTAAAFFAGERIMNWYLSLMLI